MDDSIKGDRTSYEDAHAAYYAARADEYDTSAGYDNPVVEAYLAPLKAYLRVAFKGSDALEVACGTGYWTKVVAQDARSILATDRDQISLSHAQRRMSSIENVRFERADAYSLEGVTGSFNAAYAILWWSHIPKAKIPEFLAVLHKKLAPGALVMFADQTDLYNNQRVDDQGDVIEERTLFNGVKFEIVKNVPTESELRNVLETVGTDVRYVASPHGGWWAVSYRTLA